MNRILSSIGLCLAAALSAPVQAAVHITTEYTFTWSDNGFQVSSWNDDFVGLTYNGGNPWGSVSASAGQTNYTDTTFVFSVNANPGYQIDANSVGLQTTGNYTTLTAPGGGSSVQPAFQGDVLVDGSLSPTVSFVSGGNTATLGTWSIASSGFGSAGITYTVDIRQTVSATGGVSFAASAGDSNGVAFSWQAAPVPEPHEWAMMLAGLGLVGWAAKRRRREPGPMALAA